jgi:hypothetical protein
MPLTDFDFYRPSEDLCRSPISPPDATFKIASEIENAMTVTNGVSALDCYVVRPVYIP